MILPRCFVKNYRTRAPTTQWKQILRT